MKMSIKTWKKEFYPVPASRVSKKNALAHSLRKWEGLKKSNLKKHGVKYDKLFFVGIKDDLERLLIDATTCALCHHYLDNRCVDCPLYAVIGKSCDDNGWREGGSPYTDFVDFGKASPMLRLLKKAQKNESK